MGGATWGNSGIQAISPCNNTARLRTDCFICQLDEQNGSIGFGGFGAVDSAQEEQERGARCTAPGGSARCGQQGER
jgi:hypothetical protein